MRLSRRVSHIPSLQSPTPPGPVCAHCLRPLSIQPAYIRCAEPACNSLPLCADCFSVGAYDVHPHNPSHPYRVIQRVPDQIYAKDWAAHEEERLLHALSDHGPHHWKDISDYVRSKTPAKCERHYHHVYLDGPAAPLPSQITTATPDAMVAEPPSPAPGTETKKTPTDTKKQSASNAHERTVKPGVKAGVLEGYMPLRGDFDVEWDDDAENLVADLTISPQDTQEEIELKLCLLENYDRRLTRRDAVKRILFDHDLLDFGSHKIGGSRTAKDEKELAARLKVFARLLEKNVYTSVQESVTNIYRLSREVHRLAQARDSGVHRLAEVDVYEVERKARAASLSTAQMVVEKSNRKRRRSSGGLTLPAKRARKADHARAHVPNGRNTTPLKPPLVLDENTALMYSPTPDVDALSLGVTTSEVVNNSAVNIDNPDDAAEIPAQSKTALLRKAREQRRLMRSTYPQVEPGDMKNMPGADDLTESELVMCCALKIPPAEFITLRDAMLSAFGETAGPSTSVASESAGGKITTMRATRSRTHIENNEQSDTSRLQVTYTNADVPGRRIDGTAKMDQACETIKPGKWRGKRVTRATSANSQQAAEGNTPPCLVHYTNVELNGVPTHSKGRPTASKRASDGVSSATCIENDMRLDDESRKYDTNATALHLKTWTSNRCQPKIITPAGDGNGDKEDSPDIVVEAVGKRGARLAFSLRLPNVHSNSAPGEGRQNVEIGIDVLTDSSGNDTAAGGVPNQPSGKSTTNVQDIQAPVSRTQKLSAAATDSVIETMLPVSSRRPSGTPRKRSRKGRAAGRLTIRKRSRAHGRARGQRSGTRTGVKKEEDINGGPSLVKTEAKKVEKTLPSGSNDTHAQKKPIEKVRTDAGTAHGQDERKKVKSENCLGAGLAFRKEIGPSERRDDGDCVEPASGSRKGYNRFANNAIQEEVLDEGNAASLDAKATGAVAKTISGEILDSAVGILRSGSERAQEAINNPFVYVAPEGSASAPVSTPVANQSGQGSESGESDGNAMGKPIHTSPNQCSESGSGAESLSGEDDGDPTVDFSPADEGSDDDDIDEEGKPAPRVGRRSGGRRCASYIPVRVSSRIRKRKREDDKVDGAESTGKKPRRPVVGDRDDEWTEGIDMTVSSKGSDKKPPATPMRKSARKKRPRGSEETDKASGRTPTAGRYSLRRRG